MYYKKSDKTETLQLPATSLIVILLILFITEKWRTNNPSVAAYNYELVKLCGRFVENCMT